MVRSILWIASDASLPFSSACLGLPQPRSRMALAAATRAAAVASVQFMIPARTLIAVVVWLRAIERISVIDFGIQVSPFPPERLRVPANEVSDGSSPGTPLCDNALHREDGSAVKCGRRPIEKNRDRFPGAGSIIAMMNICR
jgi:hypothetical protein